MKRGTAEQLHKMEPEWLQNLAKGISERHYYFSLFDGERYALVRYAGLGPRTYLVDKTMSDNRQLYGGKVYEDRLTPAFIDTLAAMYRKLEPSVDAEQVKLAIHAKMDMLKSARKKEDIDRLVEKDTAAIADASYKDGIGKAKEAFGNHISSKEKGYVTKDYYTTTDRYKITFVNLTKEQMIAVAEVTRSLFGEPTIV